MNAVSKHILMQGLEFGQLSCPKLGIEKCFNVISYYTYPDKVATWVLQWQQHKITYNKDNLR